MRPIVPLKAGFVANVKIMSDGPLRPALVEIGKAFHRDSGTQVEFVFETSPMIHSKVARGETADVLIIQPTFIAELLRSERLVPGEYPVVARVGLGLMVRSDGPLVDVSTIESFKAAILNAESLTFNNVASGNYFAELLERLGIAETVKKKIVRVESAIVFERIQQGNRSDIGVATIPLINATNGLRLIGPLPAELQSYITYAAALMTSATSPQAGSAFISFLDSPAAKIAFAKTGVE